MDSTEPITPKEAKSPSPQSNKTYYIFIIVILCFGLPVIKNFVDSYNKYKPIVYYPDGTFVESSSQLAFTQALIENYYGIISIIFALIFPIWFKQIFGMTIKDFFIARREQRVNNSAVEQPSFDSDKVVIKDKEELAYSISNINESRQIAEKIYNRSGFYLSIGGIIALGGVLFFASSSLSGPLTMGGDMYTLMSSYLPRFGTLIFIELVAFFFLRQYRIMIEEYKYYEGIKRDRQDKYALIQLIEKYKDNPQMLQNILDRVGQPYIVSKLAKDETTELLESKRIINQDFEIIDKITALFKEVKSK